MILLIGYADQYEEDATKIYSTYTMQNRVVITDKSRPITRELLVAEILESDLFHFAGHGTFDSEHPESTGLLSDGLLDVKTLNSILLKRSPSVVILSACKSGIGGAGRYQ